MSNLEGLEGQVSCISMVDLRVQELAYLQHMAAMESVTKVGGGSGGGGASKWRGKKGKANQGTVNKGKVNLSKN